MQTFLASFNLEQNAKFLDGRRLFKQLLEGYQILKTLHTNTGWIHHPAVKQWKGYENRLYHYIYTIWSECCDEDRFIAQDSDLYHQASEIYLKRNYPDINFDSGKYDDLMMKALDEKGEAPFWWDREDIAASHRSRLRCKGFIDAACVDIKRDLKLKSIDRWLKEKFGLAKNALKYKHLELLLKTPGVEFKTPSHYEQFGWTEDPAGEYIWPV